LEEIGDFKQVCDVFKGVLYDFNAEFGGFEVKKCCLAEGLQA
jgi:hypothetical protein